MVAEICWECHTLPPRTDQTLIKRALNVASELLDAICNTGPWISWKSNLGRRKLHAHFKHVESYVWPCKIRFTHTMKHLIQIWRGSVMSGLTSGSFLITHYFVDAKSVDSLQQPCDMAAFGAQICLLTLCRPHIRYGHDHLSCDQCGIHELRRR